MGDYGQNMWVLGCVRVKVSESGVDWGGLWGF